MNRVYRLSEFTMLMFPVDLDEAAIIYSTGPQMISDALYALSLNFTIDGVLLIPPDQRVFENKVLYSWIVRELLNIRVNLMFFLCCSIPQLRLHTSPLELHIVIIVIINCKLMVYRLPEHGASDFAPLK